MQPLKRMERISVLDRMPGRGTAEIRVWESLSVKCSQEEALQRSKWLGSRTGPWEKLNTVVSETPAAPRELAGGGGGSGWLFRVINAQPPPPPARAETFTVYFEVEEARSKTLIRMYMLFKNSLWKEAQETNKSCYLLREVGGGGGEEGRVT